LHEHEFPVRHRDTPLQKLDRLASGS